MKIPLPLTLALLIIVSPFAGSSADDDKELRLQRQQAHKERQAEVNARNAEVNDAIKEFRAFVQGLKLDYRRRIQDLDAELELARLELRAEHQAREAIAEAEQQKSASTLYMTMGNDAEGGMQELQDQLKKYNAERFALEKQAAEEIHEQLVANEERKNALLLEQDQMALERAEELGLTKHYEPVLASPIGDGLTEQEEKWNERETAAVGKLEERNYKLLGEFRNGEALREWELGNLKEDFKLDWDERTELQEIESRQPQFNTMFSQDPAENATRQQEMMTQLAELEKEKKLVSINYDKIRNQNRIKRREKKKEILAN